MTTDPRGVEVRFDNRLRPEVRRKVREKALLNSNDEEANIVTKTWLRQRRGAAPIQRQ